MVFVLFFERKYYFLQRKRVKKYFLPFSKRQEIFLDIEKKGITLSKPKDDMIEKLFACVEDSGISIQKS